MIKNNLSRILGEKRIKMSELQKMAELSKRTVLRLYHNQTSNISFDTIDKICEALEISIGDLFEHISK